MIAFIVLYDIHLFTGRSIWPLIFLKSDLWWIFFWYKWQEVPIRSLILQLRGWVKSFAIFWYMQACRVYVYLLTVPVQALLSTRYVGSMVVVGAMTRFALLYFVCNLKLAQMDVHCSFFTGIWFTSSKRNHNASKATKSISKTALHCVFCIKVTYLKCSIYENETISKPICYRIILLLLDVIFKHPNFLYYVHKYEMQFRIIHSFLNRIINIFMVLCYRGYQTEWQVVKFISISHTSEVLGDNLSLQIAW